ncbi:MAG: YqaJ viral recombinase family protein [Coriobacteriia bacterium]|nr:YqaJ viral recombinase family protein [Coriobacteriia bacterium]
MRDYIGSADAYNIYIGSYDSLIKSKLADSGYMSDEMIRGIRLERDIIEQFCLAEEHEEVELQVSIKRDYCRATLDGLIRSASLVIEAKTSKYDCPLNLMKDYPRYYYQVQWQLWLLGLEEKVEPFGVLLWCKCPQIDSGKSPYDEEGHLDITVIKIAPDASVHEVFEKNSREFWVKWREAKVGTKRGN